MRADNRAEAGKAIGADRAGGDEVRNRGAQPLVVEIAGRRNLAGERGAMRLQIVEHDGSRAVRRHLVRAARERNPAVRVVAQEQARWASRRPPAWARLRRRLQAASRRSALAPRAEAEPLDSRAHATEPVRHNISSIDGSSARRARRARRAPRRAPALPRRRAARSPRAGRRARAADPALDVLPREQEPHEVARAHRRDFGAQAIQRVAMDARQEPAVAPLQGSGIRDQGSVRVPAVFPIPDP